jgi:hypothetical protein
MKREDVIIFEGEDQFVLPKNRVRDRKTGVSYNVPNVNLVGDENVPQMERPLPSGGGTGSIPSSGSFTPQVFITSTSTTTRMPVADGGSGQLLSFTTAFRTPLIPTTLYVPPTTRTTTRFSLANFTTLPITTRTTTRFALANFTTLPITTRTTTRFALANFSTTSTTIPSFLTSTTTTRNLFSFSTSTTTIYIPPPTRFQLGLLLTTTLMMRTTTRLVTNEITTTTTKAVVVGGGIVINNLIPTTTTTLKPSALPMGGDGGGGGSAPEEEGEAAPPEPTILQKYWWILVAAGVGYLILKKRK